jgi:hypothetical protein
MNYQSQVSILGPVGYGPTTLPLRHSDFGDDCNLLFYLYHNPMYCRKRTAELEMYGRNFVQTICDIRFPPCDSS